MAVSKFARIPLEKVSTRIVFAGTGTVVNLDLIETSVGPFDGSSKPKKAHSRIRSAGSATRTDPPKNQPIPKQTIKSDNKKSKQQKTFWD